MNPQFLLIAYCALIILASMTGGWLPSMVRMTHLRTQLLMSFVAGLMLAIALLHLLPHATGALDSPSKAGAATLGGIIGMFLLMRLFHSHDHDVPLEEEDEHAHGHEHRHHHGQADRKVGWMGMIFGLALHTLVDGVALASSVAAEINHGAWMGLLGLGTFLAIALHKPLDAFAITTLMQKEGWSATSRSVVNIAFSTACPIGALAFYFGVTNIGGGDQLLGWGLAISAGFFICIALSDLLPEVAFHDHDRVTLTTALIVGVALAVAIENLPGHSHSTTHSVEHSGHDH